MDSGKILFVEDQPDTRFLYRKLLMKAGFSVTVASNGNEALSLFRKEYYEIIITDWLMPDMDGLELTKVIRNEFQIQPIIIVLTAVDSPSAKNGALFAGADEYIAKPVEKEVLFDVIERAKNRNKTVPQIESIPEMQTSEDFGFYCVGVAASTGGPSTLVEFFRSIGKVNNAAFLVVQHGPEWMLRTFVQSLQDNTDMPVHLGESGLKIVPGNIYLAPGERHMILKPDSLSIELLDTEPVNFVKPSADPLFKSISSVFGNKSVGIVLTGMGHDASIGAGYISASGGKIIVQDPNNAVLPAMPESVIKLNLADKVVSMSSMNNALLSFLK